MLTSQQLTHFRLQGYLRLPVIFEEDILERLERAVEDMQHEDRTLKSYRLLQRNPTLMSEVVGNPRLMASLTSLLGPNVVYVTNRHNQAATNEPGKTDTRLHRDILQWSRDLLTCVIYLGDSTVDNGCTWVIPGSHLLPSVGVPQPDGGGTWMAEHSEYADMLDQAVPVPMRRGSVLLFGGLVFHATGDNTSTITRPGMVLGFRSADELDCQPDTSRQVIVAGHHLYRGNDRTPAQARMHARTA